MFHLRVIFRSPGTPVTIGGDGKSILRKSEANSLASLTHGQVSSFEHLEQVFLQIF